MKKIISLFQRNYDTDKLVRPEIVPGADWVIKGEGFATQKLDGTCCLVRDGQLYKRYQFKPKGIDAPVYPRGFIQADAPDPHTGEVVGWVPVSPDAPEDNFHREAWKNTNVLHENWTYELIGPRINKNRHRATEHVLIPHGKIVMPDAPRSFVELQHYFQDAYNQGSVIEGIVWWRSEDLNCDKVKIKVKDFGIKEKPAPACACGDIKHV